MMNNAPLYESKFTQKGTNNDGSKTKLDDVSVSTNLKEYKLVYERINDFIRACQKEMETDEELKLPDNNLLYYHFSTSANTFSDKFIECLSNHLTKNVK